MKKIIFALVGVMLASTAYAQPEPPPGPDPVRKLMIPPELIMRHQEELGLKEAQRNRIKQAMKDAQSEFIEMEWQIRAEAEKLAKLLSQPQVNESDALNQADQVMRLETRMKKARLQLMIRIKNSLTPEQQKKARSFRRDFFEHKRRNRRFRRQAPDAPPTPPPPRSR